MSDFRQLQTFVEVVKQGSLSAAARQEGVVPAVIGRRLDALEERLGVRLLVRTTRRLTLTQEGAAFFEDCQRLLTELAEAEAAVRAEQEAQAAARAAEAPTATPAAAPASPTPTPAAAPTPAAMNTVLASSCVPWDVVTRKRPSGCGCSPVTTCSRWKVARKGAICASRL